MKRLYMSELLGTRTLDALRPIRHEDRLRLAAILENKAAAREIINVSEELHKPSNNEIIRMVTGIRRRVLRGVDVHEIKGRINDVYREGVVISTPPTPPPIPFFCVCDPNPPCVVSSARLCEALIVLD
ncbi:hypothetical protein QJS10_CPA16g00011 [Acorus calamus]|uniref:Flagellar motor switch protein FliG C-terminal domain-containing protein n=1 Tax=Acorus calamus TaxID=4465 RepID=A0AAV9D0P2_ACOCL|nr:hypothetical protein QJS10_CPA16g00011 [Acorus calamus]